MSETDQFATHKRSSITNRSTTGGVQSGATYQKGRGAVTGPSVVEHTHTTHAGDVKRATLATKQKFTESVCFLTQQTRWEKQR